MRKRWSESNRQTERQWKSQPDRGMTLLGESRNKEQSTHKLGPRANVRKGKRESTHSLGPRAKSFNAISNVNTIVNPKLLSSRISVQPFGGSLNQTATQTVY